MKSSGQEEQSGDYLGQNCNWQCLELPHEGSRGQRLKLPSFKLSPSVCARFLDLELRGEWLHRASIH